MTGEATWHSYDGGRSIGQQGSEKGIILRDEEHVEGARVTLERDGYTPFAITSGIYGWMVHTCFFSKEEEAQKMFEEMKLALADILSLIPYANDPELERKMHTATDAIRKFVDQFS